MLTNASGSKTYTYTLVGGWAVSRTSSGGTATYSYDPAGTMHLATAADLDSSGTQTSKDSRTYGSDGNLTKEEVTEAGGSVPTILATADPSVDNTVDNHDDDWKGGAPTPNLPQHWDNTNSAGMPPHVDFTYILNALGR